MNQTCQHCGGYIGTVVWHGVLPPKMCHCKTMPAATGWHCPQCGCTHSPYQHTCPYQPIKVTCGTTTQSVSDDMRSLLLLLG